MATLPVTKGVTAAKKRFRGLAITARALNTAKAIIAGAAFYAMFAAIAIGIVYPSISKINLDAYLGSVAVQSMTGVHITHFSGLSALLAVSVYGSFYGLIFGGAIAYIAGAALPTTIENGTLDLALSRPISRTRYYLEMWLCALLAGIIVSALTILAVWISSLFVNNANLDWQWLIITQLIEFAFFFFAIGLGMLFGAFMNAGRAAGGITVGVLAIGYLLSTLGGISSNLDWLQKIEPFYYAPSAQALIQHTFAQWQPWVLVGVGLVCGIAGLIIFNRRDLPTV